MSFFGDKVSRWWQRLAVGGRARLLLLASRPAWPRVDRAMQGASDRTAVIVSSGALLKCLLIRSHFHVGEKA